MSKIDELKADLRVFRVMSSLRFFAVVREGLGEMDKELRPTLNLGGSIPGAGGSRGES